jgi:hypothetical protein
VALEINRDCPPSFQSGGGHLSQERNKAMIYKVPMPNGTNGVKLFTLPNQQIGVEYQRGEPKVGAMAYDSAHGLSRDVSFGGGATEGNAGISDETIDKLLEFLETVLPPQMMEAVQTILGGGDVTEKYDAGSGEFVHSGAMDAAIAKMGKPTEAATIRRLHAIREAQDRVRPWVPDIDSRAPQTSAEGVYRVRLAQGETAFEATILPAPSVRGRRP